MLSFYKSDSEVTVDRLTVQARRVTACVTDVLHNGTNTASTETSIALVDLFCERVRLTIRLRAYFNIQFCKCVNFQPGTHHVLNTRRTNLISSPPPQIQLNTLQIATLSIK